MFKFKILIGSLSIVKLPICFIIFITNIFHMKSIFCFFLALSLLFTGCISSEEDKGLYKKIALEVEK